VALETISGLRNIPRIPYEVRRILLDTARDNELLPIDLSADFIGVVDLVMPTTVDVYLRLNYPDAAPIPLQSGRVIQAPSAFLRRMSASERLVPPPPLRRIFLTHAASPGGYLDLAIGGDESFYLGTGGTVAVIGISTMIAQLNTLINTTASELQRSITGVDLSAVLASTTTPLNAGLAWTSGWFALDRYATLVMTVVADRGMSLQIQQSWDGKDVDARETRSYPHLQSVLGAGDGYYSDVVAPWARLVATNTSGVNQTILRIRVGGRAI